MTKEHQITQAQKQEDNWQRSENDPDCGVRNEKGLWAPFTRKQRRFSFWYFAAIFLVIALLNRAAPWRPVVKPIEFSAFKEKVTQGLIRRVELGSRYYVGFASDPNLAGPEPQTLYRTVPVVDDTFIPLLDSMGVEYYAKPASSSPLADFLFSGRAKITSHLYRQCCHYLRPLLNRQILTVAHYSSGLAQSARPNLTPMCSI